MQRNENIHSPAISLLTQFKSQHVVHDGLVKGCSNKQSDAIQTTLSQTISDKVIIFYD